MKCTEKVNRNVTNKTDQGNAPSFLFLSGGRILNLYGLALAVLCLMGLLLDEETALEPTLEASRSFVRLTLELDRDMALPEPPEY